LPDLKKLAGFLAEKREFLFQLVQNPYVLEHEDFSDVLLSKITSTMNLKPGRHTPTYLKPTSNTLKVTSAGFMLTSFTSGCYMYATSRIIIPICIPYLSGFTRSNVNQNRSLIRNSGYPRMIPTMQNGICFNGPKLFFPKTERKILVVPVKIY